MTLSHIEQFAGDLHQEVLQRAGDEGSPLLREEAFTALALEYLSDHNEADGAELCAWEQRGAGRLPAAKVNAWALSGDGATLDLFISRYLGTGEVVALPRPDARRAFDLLVAFLRRALDGTHTKLEEASPVFEAARRIHDARESLATVRLFLLTDGTLRTIDAPAVTIPGVEVQPVVWDLEKLSKLKAGQHAAIELDFVNDYDGAIPCIQASDGQGEYRTFLAFLKAPLLAQIYGAHGQRLLERNVRAFLQAKGKVNRGLQKTLKEEPTRFLAYNNGLCCTAASVDAEVDPKGNARLKSVRDFQIVNGGQTTASIFHALKKERVDVSNVVVQMKLTVIKDPARVQEIVPLISQYANSQNKVNTADFSANGPFHQKIEQLSRAVWAPAASGIDRQTRWYYERARGSYADDRAAQGTPARRRDWERQTPLGQKFTKTDLAKFELTWIGRPHQVCLGAEKAFLRHAEWMDDCAPTVVDPTYFRHLVAKAILFRAAEKLFKNLELTQLRALAVAYGLAWLIDRSGRRINLDAIWERQRVGPLVLDALGKVMRAAHAHLAAQPGYVGEAAKKEACWHEFRAMDIATGTAWLSELADEPFANAASEDESLRGEWDAVRRSFERDERTLGELEVETGKSWVARRRREAVASYAALTWEELCARDGIGPTKRRALIELLAAAGAG